MTIKSLMPPTAPQAVVGMLSRGEYITLDESPALRANGIPYSVALSHAKEGMPVPMVGLDAMTKVSAIGAAVAMRVTIVTITTTACAGERG